MVVALILASYLLVALLGLPVSLSLPLDVRLVGGVILVVGLAIAGWVFSYRSPSTVIVSTYITFTKMFRRTPVAERVGRTEPLVVGGPQKYVRNPLYFGVLVIVFGWALSTAYTYVFVMMLAMLLWFCFVIIPIEEKELKALFGEQWEEYSKKTPMLVPFAKWKRGPTSGS
jgi:protein-S-isoprenylcysteine O-methyltransferase Ste14